MVRAGRQQRAWRQRQCACGGGDNNSDSNSSNSSNRGGSSCRGGRTLRRLRLAMCGSLSLEETAQLGPPAQERDPWISHCC